MLVAGHARLTKKEGRKKVETRLARKLVSLLKGKQQEYMIKKIKNGKSGWVNKLKKVKK